MPDYFNNKQAIPYASLETADGEIKLGINSRLTQDGDFSDIIGLSEISLQLGTDLVRVDVTFDVLYGIWKRYDFDDIIQRIVEEPYRASTQIAEGEDPEIAQRGRWVLQFGWKALDGDEILTPKINLRTTQNDVSLLSESYGSLTIRKTLLYEPVTFLNQVMIYNLETTKQNLGLLVSSAEDNNESQINVRPIDLFKWIVEDINANIQDEDFELTLDTFRFIGSNPYNGPTGERAYQEWIESPLTNTSSLLGILDDDIAVNRSTRRWLREWLKENQLTIIHTPLRTVDGSKLSWAVRFADSDKILDSHDSVERNGDGSKPRKTYRQMWFPVLDILSRESIVENATFNISTGALNAEAVRAIQENYNMDNADEDEVPEEEIDLRSGTSPSDAKKEKDFKSAFYEILKKPDKQATINIMGQPQMSVMDIIHINTENPIFNGAYNVQAVEHNITKDSYVTVIEALGVTTDISNVTGIDK